MRVSRQQRMSWVVLIIAVTGFGTRSKAQTYGSREGQIARLTASIKVNLENAKSFDNLFQKKGSLPLSDRVIVGEIGVLDVSSKGNFLVTDVRGQQVLLFDKTGGLIKKLSAENIHPGLQWRPIKAGFSENDFILVNLSAEPTFLFDSSGNCIKKIRLNRFQPMDFYVDRFMNIYGYNFEYDQFYLSKVDSGLKQQHKFGSIPEKFKNYISHWEDGGGGIVVDQYGSIYQINVSGPEIFKYSSQGKLLATFNHRPSYYVQIDSDLPDFNNPMEFFKKSREILQNVTQTFSICLLTPEILLVQYYVAANKLFAFDLCTLNGEYLLNHDFFYKDKILAAKNGRIYMTYQPDARADGYIPNPIIHIYDLSAK